MGGNCENGSVSTLPKAKVKQQVAIYTRRLRFEPSLLKNMTAGLEARDSDGASAHSIDRIGVPGVRAVLITLDFVGCQFSCG
jgi:hypothetical protein